MREKRRKGETNLVNDDVVEGWIGCSTCEEEELLVAGSSPGGDDDLRAKREEGRRVRDEGSSRKESWKDEQ